MYRISGSDDFTYVKSVIAWLNYIIFNQTEGPSTNCQIDNFASLTPSGTSAYQQDVRLTGSISILFKYKPKQFNRYGIN